MASVASPDLKIQLMATGENSGAWGTITNNNLSAIEEAIARTTDVTFANDAPTASVTLTDSNSLQAGRNFRLNLVGTGTAGHVLLLPTVEKSYLINNTLTVDVSVRNGTAAGTNLFNTQTVPAGGAAIVYTDGSAVTSAVSSASAMEVLNVLSVGGAASVGGTFTLATANSTGNLGVVGNTSVGGTFLATGGVSDVDGDLRDIPRSRTIAITTVSAAQTDAGNFIFLISSDQTVVIPTAAGTFDTGDIFSVVCAGASATISSNITSMFKVGEASATATITLGANKIASVLFVSAQHAYVTGT
jgi:hypothetical protein